MDYFVFVGRLNPPHAGHVAALKMLDKAAKSAHGKAFISLTGTQDPESNPLPFEMIKRNINMLKQQLKAGALTLLYLIKQPLRFTT